MFYKIDVLKTFAKFTGKLLRCRLLVNKVLGWRPATLLKKRRQHRSFPVNFAKLLTTPSLPNTAGQLFLNNGKMITARQFVLPKGSALRWILPIIYTVGKWLVNTFWLILLVIFRSYFKMSNCTHSSQRPFGLHRPSHCVKSPYSEIFLSAFSRIRTEYGEIRSISTCSVRMRENTDQNNSEYGHFLRSVYHILDHINLISTILTSAREVLRSWFWVDRALSRNLGQHSKLAKKDTWKKDTCFA